MVNLGIETVITFIASIITLTSSLLFYLQYRKSPDQLIGSMALAWFFYGLTQLSIALGVFWLSPTIYLLNPIFFCFCAITAQIAFDLIDQAEIISWHIGVVSVITGALIISTLFLDEIEFTVLANGDQSLLITGTTRFLVMLLAFIVVTQNFAYAVKIYRNAHQPFMNLKRNILIGNFLFGPGAFLAYFIQPYLLFPGIVDLFIALGLLLSTYSILQAPQILFVLPFKAIQLSVIEAGTGLSLFSYHWTVSDNLVPSELLTSVIEALNIFVTENVNLGVINQIDLRDGQIIFTELTGTNKYITLIATKISLSLKIGLEKFSTILFQNFSKELKRQNVHGTSAFSQIPDFINQCFPYTPKHTQL